MGVEEVKQGSLPLNYADIAESTDQEFDFNDLEHKLMCVDVDFDEFLKIMDSLDDLLDENGLEAIDDIHGQVAWYVYAKVEKGLGAEDEDFLEKIYKLLVFSDMPADSSVQERFVYRFLTAKMHRVKFQLMQKWAKEAPHEGNGAFNPIERLELEYATKAMDAMQLICLSLIHRGKVEESNFQKNYAVEIEAAISAYQDLIVELEEFKSEDASLMELKERKLRYYKALVEAYENGDKASWDKVDRFYITQVRNEKDLVHMHTMLSKGKLRLAETSLRFYDHRYPAEQMGILQVAGMMKGYFEKDKIDYVDCRISGRDSCFVGTIMHDYMAPDTDEADENGVEIGLLLSRYESNQKRRNESVIRIFGKKTYGELISKLLFNPVEEVQQKASHEIGHTALFNGESALEEFKATMLGGVVFYKEDVGMQYLAKWIMQRIVEACFHAENRWQMGGMYFQEAMVWINLMEDLGILLKDESDKEFPWKINLSPEKVVEFFEKLKKVEKDFKRLHNTDENVAKLTAKYLQVPEFAEYLCDMNEGTSVEEFLEGENKFVDGVKKYSDENFKKMSVERVREYVITFMEAYLEEHLNDDDLVDINQAETKERLTELLKIFIKDEEMVGADNIFVDKDADPNMAEHLQDHKRFLENLREDVWVEKIKGKLSVLGGAKSVVATEEMFEAGHIPFFWDSYALVGMMAENIMRKGERIKELSHIRFEKNIKNDLRIAVFEEGEKNPLEGKEFCLRGKLQTNQGRNLCFYAVQKDQGIDKFDYPKAITPAQLISDYLDEEEGEPAAIVFSKIPEINPDYFDVNFDTFSQRMMFQTLSAGIMDYMSEFGRDAHVNIGEIEGVEVLDDLTKVFNERTELQMMQSEIDDKQGYSGRTIKTLLYRFDFQDEWKKVVVAVKWAPEEEEEEANS
jgi:hypothetical protein